MRLFFLEHGSQWLAREELHKTRRFIFNLPNNSMMRIHAKLVSGRLEASDFKITKYQIEQGELKVEATVPGSWNTKFEVEYYAQDKMIVSYRLWGFLWRYTLQVSFKKSKKG
ncbi:MAG: hypothetical protein QM734_17835 [Cyclobacteriaceae bacterium]